MHFSVKPSGPFSLANANSSFGGWPTLSGDAHAVVMAFPVEGWRTSAAVVARQVDSGEIAFTVVGASGADAESARATALAALSLDADDSGWAAVGERDPVIGRLQQQYNYARPVCFHSPYEAASAFIIGHRLSIAQTRSIRAKMAQEHGDAVTVEGETFYAFPRPSVLLELERFGPVFGEKMERLHGIAHAAMEGRLDRARLRSMDYEMALADLRTLRGVGPWMAQGIAIRGGGLVDEVSLDDVTLQAVQQGYELAELPSNADILRLAEQWRPYRAWAMVLLHMSMRREGGSFRRPGRSSRARR